MSNFYTKALKEYYHTKPIRNSILAWYPFYSHASVFEQTDGLLTDWLQTVCERVVSQESAILPEEQFDYAVIVDPEEISVEMLCEYRKLLKKNGKLLLAYENPFGLQYFAGKRNPRTQLPFTFRHGESKKEVWQRLEQAGFAGQKWYYPFPNHYFTKEIYSESYLPNEFLNHRPSDFLEDDYTKVFDERELWREVIRNGAFEFLCNSYFVEARISWEEAACSVDFAAATAYRKRDRAFITTVHNDNTVKKTALYEEGVPRLREMCNTHCYLQSVGVNCMPLKLEGNALVMKRYNLPTLWDWWTQQLSEGKLKKEKLFAQCSYIRDCIYKSSVHGRVYWELVPANCFYDEKTDDVIFFDQEFYWENIDPDVALVRALWLLAWSDGSPAFEQSQQWLEELKELFHITHQWAGLLRVARDETHVFVFNPSETTALDQSIEKAVNRVERYRSWAEKEKARFHSFQAAAEKLRHMGVSQVAVYGYGVRGKTFVNVLDAEGFHIVGILDNDIPAIGRIQTDVIIVTPWKQAVSIANELRKYTKVEILILEDLL